MEIVLRGLGVSPGIAIGPALVYDVETLDVPSYGVEDCERELQRFADAKAAVRTDIERIMDDTARTLGQPHAQIFGAHLAMIDDVGLQQSVEERLPADKINVERIVDDYINEFARLLEQTGDQTFRDRITDAMDIGKRILGRLMQVELNDLQHIAQPSVIFARDLSPADTADIDVANALGFAVETGGPTSHTAILAKALEIPTVVGLKHMGLHVKPQDMMIVDGTTGQVFIRPTQETLAAYRNQKIEFESQRDRLILAEEDLASETADGRPISTLANIELPFEIDQSLAAKAQGVGLYRTEYLFINRPTLPSEDEQFEAYDKVVSAFKPNLVTLRTLDVGGDKLARSLGYVAEANPQLGWRGIRFCLDRKDIFKTQLRALLRSSAHGNVSIMFPLISGLLDFRAAKAVLERVKDDLRKEGIPFDEGVPVGAMIEVPSAVALADLLAKECDFFSIGTNDLIQYALAVDRVNDRIAHMYEPAHPAVLRMIRHTTAAAIEAGIPCGCCGEMAGDPLFTELLVGFGVTSLSMSAVALPPVRAELANTISVEAEAYVKTILNLPTSLEVRQALESRRTGRNSIASYLERKEKEAGHHADSGARD